MKTCFIIMPFSNATFQKTTLGKEELDFIYSDFIKRTIEDFKIDDKSYFTEVLRFDHKFGSIIKGIVQKLKDADLVIADLTGLNHNVMYELGVRHSLKRGTIMLSQDIESIPSDLKDYMTVKYEYCSGNVLEQKKNYDAFRHDLHQSINQLITTSKTDSPILDYLEKKELYRNEKEIETIKLNAVILDAIYEDYDELSELISDETLQKDIDENIFRELINFFLNNIQAKFRDLNIPMFSSILYSDLVIAQVLLDDLLRRFMMQDSFISLGNIIPEENIFDKQSLKEDIKKPFVNPFGLRWKKEIKTITIQDVFKNDEGVLNMEVLEDLKDYIEEEAKRLNIENEIELLLRN